MTVSLVRESRSSGRGGCSGRAGAQGFRCRGMARPPLNAGGVGPSEKTLPRREKAIPLLGCLAPFARSQAATMIACVGVRK
jgi:hypothetical protein